MPSNPRLIDISSWDGMLSFTDFRMSACAFSKLWKEYNSAFPPWSWVDSPQPLWISANRAEGYLSMENVILPSSSEGKDRELEEEEEECSCSDEYAFADCAMLVQNHDLGIHHYDFHVVYSTSYRVPVLYLRGYCSDGQLLALDEVEKDIPSSSLKTSTLSKWTFLTQEEHPYLNRPWYTLHPCGTSEWMKLLLASETSVVQAVMPVEKYLVSWFSVVGQVIGLRIPLEMLRNVGRM